MEPIVLDHISFQIEREQLRQKLSLRADGEYWSTLNRLIEEAEAIGRPKAIYKLAYIEEKGDDYVVVEGVRLTSRVLRVNLEHAHRLWLHVATCGMELHEWASALDDLLYRYWADEIKAAALGAATRALKSDFLARYQPGKVAGMAPGSLADWPLKEQRALFALLGDVEGKIGVRLTDSFLMIPNKSVSGIRFPTEESFESCMLCPRPTCPGRRAPYDPYLYEHKYRVAEQHKGE